MNDCEALLKNVSRLQSIQDVLWKRDGIGFNVFHLCQVDHYETMHSRIIAEFLNPQGSHGMGDAFLSEFFSLKEVRAYLNGKGLLADDADFSDARVTTQEVYENGRCDIVIHWRGCGIVIENKIYASDQPKQLLRYEEEISKYKEKPCIFYLTLDGHEASPDSASGVEYACISYKDEITEWLKRIAQEAFDKPYLRESILQYRNLVKELSGQSKEQKMNAEIVKDVIASPESFKAACAVRGALQDARAAIARLIMEGLALELSERENFSGMKLKHDGLYKFVEDTGRSHQYWHGFSVEEIESSKSAFRLNFEFQDKGALTNLFMGVTRWNCDKERAAKFYKVAKEDEVLKGKYGFYLEDGNGWMYGAYPTDSELRFWADDFLARMLNEAERRAFVKKLGDSIETMLLEAKEVLNKCQFA